MKGNSETASFHRPLISETEGQQSRQREFVLILPSYSSPQRLRNSCRCDIISRTALVLFLLVVSLYLLWPSNPKISVVRVNLDALQFHALPKFSLDVTLDLTIRVRNQDLYSVDYDSLIVSIGYRGKTLGHVTSGGGHVDALRSSYLNATLQLDAVEILGDAILLVEDLAKGEITFDTESRITGKLRVLFFYLPIKGKVSCEVVANTHNQMISQKNCYPE